jgi:beta-mannosidase
MISCLLVVCKLINYKFVCFYCPVFRYPVDEPFLNNVHDEVIYQVKRLQSHPSIVLWSGNNENEAAVAQNWFDIPKEKMAKVKDDYRKLYVDTVMNAVKEVDKGNNRPFITSSPSNGLESVKEDYIANDPNDSRFGELVDIRSRFLYSLV